MTRLSAIRARPPVSGMTTLPGEIVLSAKERAWLLARVEQLTQAGELLVEAAAELRVFSDQEMRSAVGAWRSAVAALDQDDGTK